MGGATNRRSLADSIDVVEGFLSHQHIDKIELFEIETDDRPMGKTRLNDEMQQLVDDALSLRKRHRVPFWVALMLTAEKDEIIVPSELLEATGFHRPFMELDRRFLDADAVLERGALRRMVDEHEGPSVLALSSRVILESRTHRHIPMLDFRISHSDAALQTIENVMREIGVAGTILQTDNSYHFYGSRPFTDRELRRFLARSLLFEPIVDQRWIAHQLIEERCSLRITPVEGGDLPRVVLHLGSISGNQ